MVLRALAQAGPGPCSRPRAPRLVGPAPCRPPLLKATRGTGPSAPDPCVPPPRHPSPTRGWAREAVAAFSQQDGTTGGRAATTGGMSKVLITNFPMWQGNNWNRLHQSGGGGLGLSFQPALPGDPVNQPPGSWAEHAHHREPTKPGGPGWAPRCCHTTPRLQGHGTRQRVAPGRQGARGGAWAPRCPQPSPCGEQVGALDHCAVCPGAQPCPILPASLWHEWRC